MILARDLVNEPANVLYPVEFARRASAVEKVGVEVEILDDKAMTKLGMGALLGVAQGSRASRPLVIMRWNGGKKGEPPVAFVGKGVCFDTGGISIKPARRHGGHEGRHGRRGLRRRPDARARRAQGARSTSSASSAWSRTCPTAMRQRPGDIVTSMSGQTIEVINTDAEGRLVLADALWYVQRTSSSRSS